MTIFADAGNAGAQAAAALARAAQHAGIANTIVSPLHGDDFNDDLRRGAVASDYAACRASPQAQLPEHRREFEAAGAIADQAA